MSITAARRRWHEEGSLLAQRGRNSCARTTTSGFPAKEVGRNEDRYEANTYNYVTTSNTNSIHRYGIYGNTIELGFSDWGLGGF